MASIGRNMAASLGRKMARGSTSARASLGTQISPLARGFASAGSVFAPRGVDGGAHSRGSFARCAASPVAPLGAASWAGQTTPLMWRRSDLVQSVPLRGMAADAEPEEGKKAKERGLPKMQKKPSLHTLLLMTENFGVGYRVAKKRWLKHYDNSYWVVSKVKTIGGRKAWGVKIWKGKVYTKNKPIPGLFTRGKFKIVKKVPGELEEIVKEADAMHAAHEAAKTQKVLELRALKEALPKAPFKERLPKIYQVKV